jgi:uncharacterized protein YcbK (DUF882 family)
MSLLACILAGSSTGVADLVSRTAARAPAPAAPAPVENRYAPAEDRRAPLVLTALNRPGDRLVVQPYDREGELIPEAQAAISHFLRCHRTGTVRRIHPGTIALLYQISRDYPGRELVILSGYRSGGRSTSPHWRARAVDLRVKGVSPARLSRELWRTYDGIAVGYYPPLGFVHVDVRDVPVRWVQRGGVNHYQAHSRAERRTLKPVPSEFPVEPTAGTRLAAAAPAR